MSSTKLKYLQYQDTLRKQFGDRVGSDVETILTYLFYKVKVNNDLDNFKNTDDADISNYFNDFYFKNFYEDITKNINQDVFLFSSIIKNTDIDVLKEYLNDNIKNYFYHFNRNKEKKSLEDLLDRIFDLREGQKLLYCYENSFELLNRIIQNKDISTTILVSDHESRFRESNFETYICIKIYIELNANDTKVLYQKNVNDSFDRIFIDASSQAYSNFSKAKSLVRHNLNNGGIAIRLMQDQLLDSSDEEIRSDREKDLNDGILKSIISIPKSINTMGSSLMARSAIIIYSNDKKHDECIFIDASNECENDSRASWFSEQNINNIIDALNNDIGNIRKPISYDTIRNNDFAFSPYYYIKNDDNLNNAIELGNVAKIFRGNDSVRIRNRLNNYESIDAAYEYKSLAASDLDEENIDYNNLSVVKVDKNIDGFVLEPGDILINKNGTRLRTSLYDKEKTLNVVPDGNIIVIRPDADIINSIYLKTYLDSENGNKDLLNIAQSGSIIRSINVSRLKKLSIPCPLKNEQDEFASKYLSKIEILDKTKSEIKTLCNDYFHK